MAPESACNPETCVPGSMLPAPGPGLPLPYRDAREPLADGLSPRRTPADSPISFRREFGNASALIPPRPDRNLLRPVAVGRQGWLRSRALLRLAAGSRRLRRALDRAERGLLREPGSRQCSPSFGWRRHWFGRHVPSLPLPANRARWPAAPRARKCSARFPATEPVRLCSLEQPTRTNNCGHHQKQKSKSDIHRIHGITTGDCGFKLPLANSRLA